MSKKIINLAHQVNTYHIRYLSLWSDAMDHQNPHPCWGYGNKKKRKKKKEKNPLVAS